MEAEIVDSAMATEMTGSLGGSGQDGAFGAVKTSNGARYVVDLSEQRPGSSPPPPSSGGIVLNRKQLADIMALTEPLDSDGCNSTSGYCIDPEQKLNASGLLQRRTPPESSSELMHGRFGFQTTILVLAVLALLLLAYAWYPRQSATEPSSNVRKKRKARESKKMK